MKRINFYLLILMVVTFTNVRGSMEINFNFDWKFHKGPIVGAEKKEFNDSSWERIDLPHDWAIYGPFDPLGDPETGKLPWKGEGWYRKTFNVPLKYSGKKIFLMFDGIMAFPKIYLNGQIVFEWDYGYNSFFVEISEAIKIGEKNTLAVHVDTREHESRWYPGAGIYRRVQMIVKNPVYVDIWGTFVSTPVIEPSYTDVKIMTLVKNTTSEQSNISVNTSILNSDGKRIIGSTFSHEFEPNSKFEFEQWLTLTNPRKWDIDDPYLYIAQTIVTRQGNPVDTVETKFGVRDFYFTPNDGFFLNDKKIHLKGVNLHHDHGPLGAAFYRRSMERKLEIMKDMGANAIRTSHNVPSPELLELCDEMGFLVIDEAYDKWDRKGGFIPGGDFFESAERNISNFIKRDRNHPSIFLWSIGNEMRDIQSNAPGSYNKINMMISYIKEFDNTRPITMVNDNMASVKYRHHKLIDVHAWNYGRRYMPARLDDPSKAVIISESASTVSTRGYYSLPLPKEKTDFYLNDLQLSSYDMNAPAWAEPAEQDFFWQEKDKFVAGEFVWTGFDYLGEPTPYNFLLTEDGKISKEQTARSSYFGIVDLCGMTKDRYYIYRSYWRPDETTIHILPHWNWEGKEGKPIPVMVHTNGDKAELFLNNKSLGFREKKPKSNNIFERYRLIWDDVIYEQGELKVVVYKNGSKIGEKILKTAGDVSELNLKPDRNKIVCSGEDLTFIEIEALDKDGNFCPLAEDELQLEIEGPATIIAVGNGNPQSLHPFKSNSVKLFFGKALVILKSVKDMEGEIILTVKNNDLISSTKLISSSK